MNVVYISYDGLTDPLGKSQVLPYVLGLSQRGYTMTVLSYEKRNNYHKFKEEIATTLAANDIVWKPLSYHSRFSVMSTVFDLIRGARALKRMEIDIVHCRSYISAFLGLLVKRRSGAKFIFDMRGFWPDERKEVGMLKSHLLYSIMKRYEKKFLLNADSIISLTDAGIREMESWPYMHRQEIEKCTQISTCCDITRYKRALEINSAREVDNTDYKFVYVGSIGPWHSLKELCNFIKFTYHHFPKCSFKLIVNQGKELLHAFINENQLDETRISIDNISHDKMPEALEHFDIGFFFIPPKYAKKASAPTKMGEMLSAGLPIITGHSIGDVDHIIESNDVGYVIKSFDDSHYLKALDHVTAQIESDRQAVSKRCVGVAKSHFSLEKAVTTYAEIYSKLMN